VSRLGYARVSTTDQNPQLQIDALTVAGCERLWTDRASGGSTARPELSAVLDYARPGDVLVVWKLDRLGRSLPNLVQLLERLHDRRVGFVSLTEGMDTETAAGRLLFHVVGALAEFERSLIRERTAAGLAAARANGRTGGRPSTVSATQLRAAQAVIAAGNSNAFAARSVGVSRQSLGRALARARRRSCWPSRRSSGAR
jgi:DNA invertase Pin-like site-specific DNA recombinase